MLPVIEAYWLFGAHFNHDYDIYNIISRICMLAYVQGLLLKLNK